MSRPENLPENLNLIRDAAIDYALGRSKLEPEHINVLYEWFEGDGYDFDEAKIIDNGFDFSSVAIAFNDKELSLEEGLDEDAITDEVRIKFARKLIGKYTNSDSNYMLLIVLTLPIENANNEKAIIGLTHEEQGMYGLGIRCYGVYKSENEFIEDLKNSDSFMLIGEAEVLTDKQILSFWNKYH
jgi:hypothetical protein